MSRPLVFLAIAFAFGIVMGKTLSIPLIFLCLAAIPLFIFCLLNLKSNLQIPILILVILIGMVSYKIATLPPGPNDISWRAKGDYITIIGEIVNEPNYKDENVFFILKAQSIKIGEEKDRVSGLLSVMVKSSNVNIDYGDTVELRGRLSGLKMLKNPGVPSFSDWLESRGIHSQLFCYLKPKILGHGGNIFFKLCILIKNRFVSVIKRTMPSPYASLMGSIVFGSSASPIPQETEDNYRRAGVIHLLVVSGTQVSILIGVSLSAVRSFGFPLWFGVILTSIINLLFMLMTGAGPSIVRATIMGEITMFGLLFEREKDFYTSLALAAAVLLIMNPLNLFEAGFQLSFAATWALVYISPVIEEKLNKVLPKLISGTASISIAPVLATTPITVYNFSQLSVVALFTNFLIITWVEILVVLGFLSTVLGTIFLPVASLLNGTNLLILKILNWIITAASSLPFACIFLASPTFPIIIGYYIILIYAVEALRQKEGFKLSKKSFLIAVLFLISIFIWNSAVATCGSPLYPKQLVVTFLDVGQGDSILVETPEGKKMLVDGGGSEYQGRKDLRANDSIGERVVAVLHRKGINKLDVVVLTHPHDDHVGGLSEVLKDIKVDLVLDSGQPHTSSSYIRFLRLIDKNKIPYKLARPAQIINLGSVKGYVLAPIEPFIEHTYSDLNNNSVVVRLVYGKTSILFPGDIEIEGEKRLIEAYKDIKSDILKAGHHGSKTSSSDEFLDRIKPKVAIISVGAHNKFFHPNKETLARFKAHGAEIYRTDLNGAVIVKTDGENYLIETMK